MFDDILVYVPEKELHIIISEGSGDNLLDEDVENGYVDYLNYYTFTTEDLINENIYDEGGMLMYKELIQEKFTDITQTIPDVIYDVFNEKGLRYCIVYVGERG